MNDQWTCPTCGGEMWEYADDRHGVSEFSLSPTTFCGSVIACPEHGTAEQQRERAEAEEYGVGIGGAA